MDKETTIQSPHGLSLGYHGQDEVQVSTFPDSDENFDSDIQSNISSRSGNTSEDSETDLESDDENDELNIEVGEDGLHDYSEEESQISSHEQNHPILIILEKQLDESIPENTSCLSAVYTIVSPDTAEIWALGEVTRLKLRAGWPYFDTLFSYIEIRDYGSVVCPSEIYRRAQQLLCIGGTIYYVQILPGVSEKSRYNHNKSNMEQEFQVPTGFSFYKVLKLSLGSKELEAQDFDTRINHLLLPRGDRTEEKLSINAVYSSWKNENDCEDGSRDIFS